MSDNDIWVYHPASGHQRGIDLVGYKVEATDGGIGKVSKHADEVGSAHLVVDTGVWIFGRHVLLPAGTIKQIDTATETVHVARTKEQIKDAPEFDEMKHAENPGYLEQFARYYGQPHM
ncbi:PRC-barrel domain containing protein [Streptomyces sp. NPDC047971]|uniref:PRC-barrel domain containing protein n=1 Tax=Streptomyces sp. NPDC047971 TaxID=3154499 RepID=UPI00340888F8